MPVRLTILGSGSAGNCAYVETDDARILIDAGFSLRQIRKRLALIGRGPENLSAILITHEHSDHIQGLVALSERFKIPVFCNRPTQEAIHFQSGLTAAWRIFSTGCSFEVGDILVETFSVPHDAQDPVGFLLRSAAGNIGFLTDLGHVNRMVLDRVRQAHILVLEANHDIKMVQDCPHRPWSLKQRILGRHGHLSNESAADAVEQLLTADFRHLYLGHLSRECNRPDLARQVMSQRLQRIGATHVRLELAAQGHPSPTLTL